MIGTTLKNILDQKGITANELARQIDVSNQTLYSIIKRDNMKVDFDLLLKICDALDVDIEIFYRDYLSEKQKNNISIDKQPPLQNNHDTIESQTPDKSQADINAILRKKEQEDIEYLKLKKNTINYIRMAKLDMYQLYELQGVISALEKVYDMKHGSE